MTAASILRAARASSGVGQAELARRAHTSQSDISLIESGKRKPNVETFARLLNGTGHHLIAVKTSHPDAVETASLISATVFSGDQEFAFRRFIDYSDGLAASRGVERVALTIAEPLPTGIPKWDAAIAAVAEYWLDEENLPKPSWLDLRTRVLDEPESLAFSVYDGPPDPAEIPAQFAARGVMVERSTLASV